MVSSAGMNDTEAQSAPNPRMTVMICVYSGEPGIRRLLQSLAAQNLPESVPFEILVVDNNSRDATRAICETFSEQNPGKLRLLTERQQGKGYALNHGLAEVRGEICCIVDHDQILHPDYLKTVWAAFERYPSISFVGGKVLSNRHEPFPDWVTKDHWSPIALCDYGDEPFDVNSQRLLCLLAAAFRTADMRLVGGYRAQLGVGPEGPGSVEDADIFERLVNVQKTGKYIPEVVVHHGVEDHRLTRNYHRRWHFGHGRYFAEMHSPSFEASSWRIAGIPGHVWRHGAADLGRMILSTIKGERDKAFSREVRLQFSLGYVLRRWKVK